MKFPISVSDVSRQNSLAKLQIFEAISNVVDSGGYILGEKVEEFELAFAEYCGVNSVVGVANGTDAIELALRALDIGEGDEVVTIANACMFATIAILATGAKPVYADVNPRTGLIDVASVAKKTGPDTRAIIATHLFGKLADIDGLKLLIGNKKIFLIEDAAQAHGARSKKGRAGALADIACFSFYPTKNLGGMGDAGAVATHNGDIATRVKQLRQYGWGKRFECRLPGGRNSRMDELQAAILLAKLPFLDDLNHERQTIAQHYISSLSDLPVILPTPGDDHVFHLFVIQLSARNGALAQLRHQGINADIHYPVPDYRQDAVTVSLGQLPELAVTEKFVSRILTLPCFPGMTEQEIDFTIEHVRNAVLASVKI